MCLFQEYNERKVRWSIKETIRRRRIALAHSGSLQFYGSLFSCKWTLTFSVTLALCRNAINERPGEASKDEPSDVAVHWLTADRRSTIAIRSAGASTKQSGAVASHWRIARHRSSSGACLPPSGTSTFSVVRAVSMNAIKVG